jgi:hypothetical protein
MKGGDSGAMRGPLIRNPWSGSTSILRAVQTGSRRLNRKFLFNVDEYFDRIPSTQSSFSCGPAAGEAAINPAYAESRKNEGVANEFPRSRAAVGRRHPNSIRIWMMMLLCA